MTGISLIILMLLIILVTLMTPMTMMTLITSRSLMTLMTLIALISLTTLMTLMTLMALETPYDHSFFSLSERISGVSLVNFIKDQCMLQMSANNPNQGESIPRTPIRARNICKLISFSVLDTVLTIYWVEDTVWVEKEAGQEMNGANLCQLVMHCTKTHIAYITLPVTVYLITMPLFPLVKIYLPV